MLGTMIGARSGNAKRIAEADVVSGKEQRMSRWIDADALVIDYYDDYETKDDEYSYPYVSISQIDSAPSIDMVRCQDCKYWVYNFNGCSRNPCTEPWYAEDFCSYGEREGE